MRPNKLCRGLSIGSHLELKAIRMSLNILEGTNTNKIKKYNKL